jgi:hypothetical protein
MCSYGSYCYLQITLQYTLFVIHTASKDCYQRQGDTLRQNAETISEGPLPNSLV